MILKAIFVWLYLLQVHGYQRYRKRWSVIYDINKALPQTIQTWTHRESDIIMEKLRIYGARVVTRILILEQEK